jgi:hypothetical protein
MVRKRKSNEIIKWIIERVVKVILRLYEIRVLKVIIRVIIEEVFR